MRDRLIKKMQRMFWTVRSQQDLDPGAARATFSPCFEAVYHPLYRAYSDELGWRMMEGWNED